MSEPTYTPDRLRALAGKVYRFGASFNVPDLREVGDYLGRAALAADEQGDILQQHAAAKAELFRLQHAVAEADAARIALAEAQATIDRQRAEIARRDGQLRSLTGAARMLREELDGQRLWYRLALEWIEELRPLIPADKQTLIDPMRAAGVAQDHRRLIHRLLPLLRRLRDWASLHAQTANDPAARADVGIADALLESDECRKFSPTSRS